MNSRVAPPYQLAANMNGHATALALINLAETLADSVVLSGKSLDAALDDAARVIGGAVDCARMLLSNPFESCAASPPARITRRPPIPTTLPQK